MSRVLLLKRLKGVDFMINDDSGRTDIVIYQYDYMLERHEFTYNVRNMPYWSIFCVESGSFYYDIVSESGFIRKGETLVTAPNEVLRRRIIEPLTMHQISFSLESDCSGVMPHGKFVLKNTERLTSTLFALRHTAYKTSEKIKRYQAHLIEDIIYLYIMQTDPDFLNTAVVSNDIITDMALMYMDNNIFDSAVIGKIAAASYISPVQFTRRFKSVMGMSPIEYLTEKRIGKVRYLLLTTQLTLSEIAEKCGYSSGFYLSRVFKSKMGMSPSEYRKAGPDIETEKNDDR